MNDREEYYYDWKTDNQSHLELEFLRVLPPEDVPLDDDLPDFMEGMEDEFDEFCREVFSEGINNGCI